LVLITGAEIATGATAFVAAVSDPDESFASAVTPDPIMAIEAVTKTQ
jgi:hypothetical protein